MTLVATLLRRSKNFVAVPILAVISVVGWYVDREDNLSLTRFRGKSKLYGREYAPGEKPPWP
uniref:NADH dehydrogenase n=1 Tax=Rhipicephalus sanguineus TaxID=34632 RepID=C9W1R9_RHISA